MGISAKTSIVRERASNINTMTMAISSEMINGRVPVDGQNDKDG